MGICISKKSKRHSISSKKTNTSQSNILPYQTERPNNSIDLNSTQSNKNKDQNNSSSSKSNINNDSVKMSFNTKKYSNGLYYPNKGVNETIIKIEIDEKEKSYSLNSEFIFILDVSGSMGSYVNQILTKVMPRVYEKLNYPNEKKIHLITFETNSKYYHWNKYDFLDTKINGDGGTNMNNVPNKLGEILKNMNEDTLVNILTLSDGEISDQELTLNKTELIYNQYFNKFNYINSNAIRFHSYENSSPDTRALCSLLKFNKNKKSNLIEFSPYNYPYMTNNKIEEFSNLIYENFNEEISGWKIVCENNDKKLRIEPIGELKNSIFLKKGQNTFLYDGVYDNLPDLVNVTSTDGSSKNISFGENVNQENLNEIYEDTIFNIFDKVINNKVVNTFESNKKNLDFINYIKLLEDKTEETDKVKKNNKLSNKLKEINSNNEVIKLNANQLNDFIQKEKKECENELKEIQKEIDKITKLQINNDDCTILLIDNSIYMKNYINNLIQNVIYQSLINLDLNEKYKIRLYGFDETYKSVPIVKLKNLEFDCESNERKICKPLETIWEIMINDPVKKYNFISIFSGEIDDKNDIRIFAYKMLGLRERIRIKSRIVKYIINESNFPKKENGEIDENKNDDITYGLIKQIDSEGLYSCKPLVIYDNEEINIKIEKFTQLFFRDEQ